MSVKIMTLVWEHAPCRENSLMVLLALADWANDEAVCWPSIQKLADKTRIDRRSAQRIIRRLVTDGLITIEEGGGRAKQHKYHIETAALCRPLENSDFRNGGVGDTKRAALETERATFPTQTATPVSPDPLEDPLEDPPVEPTPQARLLQYHADRLKGNVPDFSAQAGAVKWLVTRYAPDQAIECYEFQLTEPWRKGHVTWLTVKQRIAEWVAEKTRYVPQRKIVADHGDWYEVEACNGVGTSPRYRTAEAFARRTGRTLEEVGGPWTLR